MDPFQMVVVIVVVTVGAGVINNYLKLKASRSADSATDMEVQRTLAEIERLKERVRVLEKIVTDKDRALAEEIRKLA